jgi:hypothetical protein
MLIASLNLVAFPFKTGFYSKDFILESAYGQFYFSKVLKTPCGEFREVILAVKDILQTRSRCTFRVADVLNHVTDRGFAICGSPGTTTKAASSKQARMLSWCNS